MLPGTQFGRRGYRPEEVHALLDRLAYELAEQSRDSTSYAENDRLKRAVWDWQSNLANVRCYG